MLRPLAQGSAQARRKTSQAQRWPDAGSTVGSGGTATAGAAVAAGPGAALLVPERADEATVAARRERVMAALARVLGAEAFDAVAREVSEDGNRARGGEIGLLPAARLPDVFIEATRLLRPGEVTAQPLRSGAGFHILKVVERKEIPLGEATETRARHVLLRTSPQLSAEVASRRLADYRRQIETGARSFEDIARQYSEDGSAASGGELGWPFGAVAGDQDDR